MLTLILFRHAKSDWDAEFNLDHARPLNSRGLKTARQMGRFLTKTGHHPNLAIASSARRATETLRLAAEQGTWDCPLRFEDRLYESTPETTVQFLHELDCDARMLVLVGHEPTWSALAGRLVGASCHIRIPTGAMARIDFTHDNWADIRYGSGELRWLVPPKVLPD